MFIFLGLKITEKGKVEASRKKVGKLELGISEVVAWRWRWRWPPQAPALQV